MIRFQELDTKTTVKHLLNVKKQSLNFVTHMQKVLCFIFVFRMCPVLMSHFLVLISMSLFV